MTSREVQEANERIKQAKVKLLRATEDCLAAKIRAQEAQTKLYDLITKGVNNFLDAAKSTHTCIDFISDVTSSIIFGNIELERVGMHLTKHLK